MVVVKLRLFRPIVTCSLVLASGMACATDLMQAWQAARQFDSAISSARAQREAGIEKRTQGRAPLLPQLGASGSYTRSFPDQPAILPDYNTKVMNGQVTQVLFDWAKFAGLAIGDQQALIADDQLTAAEQALILRVAQAYFDVLLAENSVTYAQGAKDAFAQALAQAKKSFEVGTVTIVDTREAQANYDSAVAVEIQALNTLAVKRNAFQLLTGLPATGLQPLMDNLPLTLPEPSDVSAWLAGIEHGNLDVLIRQKQLLIAQKSIEVSRSGHLPTVSASAGWQKAFSNQPTSLPGSSDSEGKTAGITINIPLFAGGGVQSQVREKAALRDAARDDLETARRTAEQSVRTAYLGVTAGAAQVQARQNVLASSESQLAATRLGMEVGVRTLLDVLNAEQKVFQARRDLAEAKYTYLLARLQLAQGVGRLTPEELAALNRLLAGQG